MVHRHEFLSLPMASNLRTVPLRVHVAIFMSCRYIHSTTTQTERHEKRIFVSSLCLRLCDRTMDFSHLSRNINSFWYFFIQTRIRCKVMKIWTPNLPIFTKEVSQRGSLAYLICGISIPMCLFIANFDFSSQIDSDTQYLSVILASRDLIHVAKALLFGNRRLSAHASSVLAFVHCICKQL